MMKTDKHEGHSLTKGELLAFIEKTIQELEQNSDPKNESLYALLLSMASWLEAANLPDTPSTEAFAKILHASPYYK
ncbi:hypothetical protein [Brevibacillus reuszeri]|nr:hypothetical protein [Brevibacillus reuszeri]MED1860508.1 hypothetical protein [Brevibacillus reuszeri]